MLKFKELIKSASPALALSLTYADESFVKSVKSGVSSKDPSTCLTYFPRAPSPEQHSRTGVSAPLICLQVPVNC